MCKPDYSFEDITLIQNIIKDSSQSTLLKYYAKSTASFKTDGSIVTEADIEMQKAMDVALKKHYPEILLLSEELTGPEQISVLNSNQDYWCLDPVDGTNNYHCTLPLFSVSLALISQNEIVLAIIYDPMRDEFFSAIKGQGMWVNDHKTSRPEQPNTLKQSIAFIDFKRLSKPIKLSLVEQAPYKSQRNVGSCALEWAWLAAGRVQLLLHGKEKYWDYAAGVLLNEEAGGQSQTLESEAVFNQSLDSRSVVAASTVELFEQWTDCIQKTTAS
ncbi:MAG: myo-inositol-1(or 4)-monophosphatase [Candidatus Azotimanducaceae bacterium]